MADEDIAPRGLIVSVEEMHSNVDLQARVTAGDLIVAHMSKRALEAIEAPTPPGIIEKKGGFDYVSHVHYRAKLARAYGYDYDWVCQVDLDWAHELVIAHGTLTVRYRNPLTGEILSTRTTTGQDAQQMLKLKSGSGYVDIGNQMKGADSEALKIAVKNLGFFQDLYVKEGKPSLEEAEAQQESLEKAEARIKEDGQIIEGQATQVIRVYACSACGKDVEPGTTKSGKPFTSEEMAKLSRDRYQTFLCGHCYADRVRRDKAKLDEEVAAAVKTAEKQAAEKVETRNNGAAAVP